MVSQISSFFSNYVYNPIAAKSSDKAKTIIAGQVANVKAAVDSFNTQEDIEKLVHVNEWLKEETREKGEYKKLKQEGDTDKNLLKELKKFSRATGKRHVNLARTYGKESTAIKAINDAIRPLVVLFVTRLKKEEKAPEKAFAKQGLEEIREYTKNKLIEKGAYEESGDLASDRESILERKNQFQKLLDKIKDNV